MFVLGSSQGSAAAFHSLAFSDPVDGAVADHYVPLVDEWARTQIG